MGDDKDDLSWARDGWAPWIEQCHCLWKAKFSFFGEGKEVFIPSTKAPFEKNEVRYAETSFFDEVADEGEGMLSRPVGLRLPR
ncbi:hypothetical protein COLO4_26524 [Corchorus olitorius]|uniref:Uncharacterized protein n=1 Tax=Corchorus olitorius TaxID=93759 RepID=A0A1R3HWY5_9ROSI|nr:hypothetical protein COLO4_26524 [Corchorus olitorius]